jgi:Ca2+:H+ antiporter
MGCAFLAGGVLFKTQSFSQAGAGVQSSMLVLSVLALAVPTMYGSQIADVQKAQVILELSRYTGVLLLVVYVLFLVFQLKTHAYLFEGDGGEEEEPVLSAFFAGMLLAACTVPAPEVGRCSKVVFRCSNYNFCSCCNYRNFVPKFANFYRIFKKEC